MRRSENPHRDAAPYALGVLEPGDAHRFEDHLRACPHCASAVTGFGAVRRQLDAYARCTPPGVPLLVAPGGGVLRGALDAAAAGQRAVRGRRAALVAVLVVGAALVAGGPLGAPPDGEGPRQAVARWSGADGATGTTAVATAASRAWGSRIALSLSGSDVPGACALVAVGRDGSRETVTTWSGAWGRAVVTAGGAALRPGQIDHFEVRAPDGRRLVTLAE
ncbi:zf-HC2 domain-containing protein [Streptomyces sp. 8L]|uniref:zf-HC2 domain-containing protein n=1 Tax=Streptomyces sp. 8L TaxID=2877242 RepID=UPI001CD227BE|nr:zf-HC2 domain-containing protein [Streptomyces sp. 8L]MCA1222047.1 zf-HC2 domain-containing protein [Streptomyces sp. 8L]